MEEFCQAQVTNQIGEVIHMVVFTNQLFFNGKTMCAPYAPNLSVPTNQP
jgi:hypothetical protein